MNMNNEGQETKEIDDINYLDHQEQIQETENQTRLKQL